VSEEQTVITFEWRGESYTSIEEPYTLKVIDANGETVLIVDKSPTVDFGKPVIQALMTAHWQGYEFGRVAGANALKRSFHELLSID